MGVRNGSAQHGSGFGHQGIDGDRGQYLARGFPDQEREAYGAQAEPGLGRRVLRRRLRLVSQVNGAPNHGQGSPENHHNRQYPPRYLSYRKHGNYGTRKTSLDNQVVGESRSTS